MDIEEIKQKILPTLKGYGVKKVGISVLKNLEKKAKLVNWNNMKREELFGLFSKSGFDKKCIDYCRKNNILLYTLDDLEKLF